MKFLGYGLALVVWAFCAIIFRYGLYPPSLIFWLTCLVMSFIGAGIAHDRLVAVKVMTIVWLTIPLVEQVYPSKQLVFIEYPKYIIVSIAIAFLVGIFAASLNPTAVIKTVIASSVILSIIIGALFYSIYHVDYELENGKLQKADAAIILGAAVWEGGRPSPSMYARVKEGLKLYEKGKVQKLIVSGGLGRYAPTEAEVMAQVAISMGVNQTDLILEKKATTTEENLLYSKFLGDELGFENYILVSDAFHLKRALLIAHKLDMSAQGAAALDSPLYTNQWLKVKYTVREVFGLIKFYVFDR